MQCNFEAYIFIFYRFLHLTEDMSILLTMILAATLQNCFALPVGKTEETLTSDGVSSIVVIMSVLLAVSVTVNVMMVLILYYTRKSANPPERSSFKSTNNVAIQIEKSGLSQTEESSYTQLDSIVQRGDMRSLQAFFNLTDNQFSLHKAIRLACQFRQCKILHHLNSMVRSGDDIMKKMLEDEVKNETVTGTERCKIVECLLLCVKDRGTLDSKLVAWAIQHASLGIVTILLFNKLSSHIDLNAYDDEPSPIMACFRRPNMCEASQILRNLWERTLYQACNVKTQTLRDTILNWGENERPLHHGEGLPKNTQKALLTYIAEIDDRKRSQNTPAACDTEAQTGIVEVESESS